MDKRIKVALVVGHSEEKQGASNKKYLMTEYFFNYKLVKDICDRLNKNCISPLIILRDNIKYKNLPNEINKENPKFIISFHCNAFNKKANGSEFLFWNDSRLSKNIAYKLNENMIDLNLFKTRDIKSISSQEDRGGFLLKNTAAPCVIAETFFIDNDEDCKIARENYLTIVKFYTNSIIRICEDLFRLKIKCKTKNGNKIITSNKVLLKNIEQKLNKLRINVAEKLDDVDQLIDDIIDEIGGLSKNEKKK